MNIYCFDFDETIVKAHYHNILSSFKRDYVSVIEASEESEGELIRDKISRLLEDASTGIRNPNILKKIMSDILKHGDKIAIVSFSKFPIAIDMSLTKLGLSENERRKIHIVSGFPSGPRRKWNKNEHIEEVMIHFDQEFGEVYLIDDDIYNCKKAEEQGYKSIIVENDNHQYLQNLKDTILKDHIDKMMMKNLQEFVDSHHIRAVEYAR